MAIPRWSPGVTLAQIDAMPREVLDDVQRVAEARRAEEMARLARKMEVAAQVARSGPPVGETAGQRRRRRLGY